MQAKSQPLRKGSLSRALPKGAQHQLNPGQRVPNATQAEDEVIDSKTQLNVQHKETETGMNYSMADAVERMRIELVRWAVSEKKGYELNGKANQSNR